jgi:hypothetical protein
MPFAHSAALQILGPERECELLLPSAAESGEQRCPYLYWL